MKRNLKTILLLFCAIVLMLGGALLYQMLTTKAPEELDPDPTMEETGEMEAGEEMPQVLIPETEQKGSSEEIAQETDSLEAAVDFTFTDRFGEEQKLSTLFGKPIIINFWATWCGPCQMELPYFNEANEKYGDKIQFVMLDLADGAYETREGAIAFAENKGYSFPLYFDELGEGSLAYSITAIPLTVVINADGQIVDTHLGTMSSEELQVLIDKVLN